MLFRYNVFRGFLILVVLWLRLAFLQFSSVHDGSIEYLKSFTGAIKLWSLTADAGEGRGRGASNDGLASLRFLPARRDDKQRAETIHRLIQASVYDAGEWHDPWSFGWIVDVDVL